MEDETRKVFYFDLNIKNLKLHFSKTNPNYAYTLIEKYMESHGFEHRQYSGYMSNQEMSIEAGISLCKGIAKKFPWLHKCVERFDMATVPVVYDMAPYLGIPKKKNCQIEFNLEQPLLVDVSNDYKLYKTNEADFMLVDEDENEVGITDYDNIEDALDDIKQQNNELEL